MASLVSAGGGCGGHGSPRGSLGWPHSVARLTFDHCWLPGSNVGLRENTSLILHPCCPKAKPADTALRSSPVLPPPPPHWELGLGAG